MSRALQRSYTLLAPVYDWAVDLPTRQARRNSLHQLGDVTGKRILLCGIGSGLDLPWLPQGAEYTGIDLTAAMLKRAGTRTAGLNIGLHQGDVMRLPYPDNSFDTVIQHLILAVVPAPQQALNEAARVLKPGGRLLILDKFLKPGQTAPVRRLLSPLIGKIATRTDVVFEHLHAPALRLLSDKPALAGGWFRHLLLEKNGTGG